MAKIKFGMMMTDARGKLGGQVFSKNRGGAYVRTKVTPSNPRTLAQMESRNLLGQTSSAWNGLTDAQRLSWNSAVPEWQRTDVFGDLKTPSGKNLFVELNKNLLQAGLATLDIAPDKEEIVGITATAVAVDATAGEVTLTGLASVPTGFVLQVSATPPISPGISFVKNRFRVVDYVAAGAVDGEALYSAYTDKFGALSPGDNVHFQLKYVALNGQAGVPLQFKATIS